MNIAYGYLIERAFNFLLTYIFYYKNSLCGAKWAVDIQKKFFF